MIKHLIISLCLLTALSATAAPTPSELLGRVYRKLQGVKDYSADVRIRSDIPMIKVMPVNGQVYFKQKNRFKIKSAGIAILPKQGFGGIAALLADSNAYMAVVSGAEQIGRQRTVILSLIPLSDTGDLILAKVWVDTARSLALRTLVSSKSSGSVGSDYFYSGAGMAYGLPDSMVFTVDVKKFKIPKAVAADLNKASDRSKDKDKQQNQKGKIYIRIKNYKINKGIPDSVFK